MDNTRILELYKAIEAIDVDSVKDSCDRLAHDSALINNLFTNAWYNRRKMVEKYIVKNCMDILLETLINCDRKTAYDGLVDIFRILVVYGMAECNEYYWFQILRNDHIKFLLRITPFCPNENKLRYMIYNLELSDNKIIINYINNTPSHEIKKYLAALTLNTRGSIIELYIRYSNMLKYHVRTEEKRLLNTDIRGLIKLLNIVDCSYLSTKYFKHHIDYMFEDYKSNNGVDEYNKKAILCVLSLLIFAGFKYTILEPYKKIMVNYLLQRHNRWILKRSIKRIIWLPIPLESRLQLGEIGKIFDRYHINQMLKN